MSLRICMVTGQPVLFDARVQREARSLIEVGHSVTIAYVHDARYMRSVQDPERALAAFHEAVPGVGLRPIHMRTREWLWLPRFLNKAIQSVEFFAKFARAVLAARPDVVHSHDLIPGVFALLGRFATGASIVYDAHELEVGARNPILRAVQRGYERVVVRFSDAVFTVNEHIAGQMERAYGKPVAIVSNRPLRPKLSADNGNRLRADHGVQPHERIVLYVGWVAPRLRCLEEVVQALALLDDNVVLLIMATGRLEEFKPHLYRQAEQAGVRSDRVRFIGPYPPGEIFQYLRGAEVSVVLYRHQDSENMMLNAPNKLFQSIVAGTPVVAANNATLPRFVLENEVGPIGEIADPSSPASIAEAIRRVLDPERQALFRNNALRLAPSITWESDEARLRAAYDRIAQKRAAK